MKFGQDLGKNHLTLGSVVPLAIFSFYVSIHKSVSQSLVEDCKRRIDKVERFQEGQRCSEILNHHLLLGNQSTEHTLTSFHL